MRLNCVLFSVALFPTLLILSGCKTPSRTPQSVSDRGIESREDIALETEAAELRELDLYWEDRFETTSLAAEFRTELRGEIERRVRSLKRPVRFFHYGTRDADRFDARRGQDQANAYTSPIELEPREANAYFKTFSAGFRNAPMESQVGPGIYAAADPLQSEDYMGKPWFLMEITAPAGMRYVDVRPDDSFTFSKKFIAKWSNGSKSFQNQSKRYGNRFLVDFRRLLEVRAFRTEIVRIFADLRIDAIAYDWGKPAFNRCREIGYGQTVAFNFVNPAFLVRAPALKVYVENLEVRPTPTKRSAYSALLEVIRSAPLRFYGSTSVTVPSPGASPIVSQQPSTWMTNSGKARVLTRRWSEVLHQPYLPPLVLKNLADTEKLYESAKNYVMNQGIVEGFALDLRKTKEEEASNSTAGTFTYRTVVNTYDPLSPGRKNPVRSRVENFLEKNIFGCSTAHPEENKTPEI